MYRSKEKSLFLAKTGRPVHTPKTFQSVNQQLNFSHLVQVVANFSCQSQNDLIFVNSKRKRKGFQPHYFFSAPHISYPYNPIIADVLFKTTFLENWGSGAGRIMDACKSQNVEVPTWTIQGGFIIVTFNRTTNDVGIQVRPKFS